MNISKEHLALLPEDFDWECYLKYNPDLEKAGLVTQNHAIAHYLIHGRNEARIYKSVLKGFLPSNFKGKKQKLSLTGLSWFVPAGSYGEWDYIRFRNLSK